MAPSQATATTANRPSVCSSALVDAELHQQERDGDVEDQPDDAARMAVGEAREEVRPGERAGIGVHHVDLELRDDDEGRRQDQRRIGPGQHIAEGDAVHLRRLGGMARRHAMAHREHGEERAEQQLRRAEHDPARAGRQRATRAISAAVPAVRRQEAQHVDLLADLRHQGEDHRGGAAELQDVESSRSPPCQARDSSSIRRARASRPTG